MALSMLKQIHSGVQTHRIVFEPADAPIMIANFWKSTARKHHADQVALVRLIAATLLRDDLFVLFHYDGDAAYAKRAECEHDLPFTKRIQLRVKSILSEKLSPPETVNALSRLITFRPFYCMESWVYQHYTRVRQMCQDNESDVKTIDLWAASPGAVEEVEKPWEYLSIGKSRNLEAVSQGYPGEEVWLVGKSYHDVLETLMAADGLSASLRTVSG
jgi:hypothetical protein